MISGMISWKTMNSGVPRSVLAQNSYKNSLTGHFLVHPNSYVFFMNSYMNSWFFMNSYMNSVYELCARTLLGTPEFIVFHEFMPDIMDFGLFSWERSYEKSCLTNIVKNIVKNMVKWWKISMNSSLNLIEFMARSPPRCADAPYLTGPGHSAAAAPEPPASLSACLFQQLQSKYTSESEPYL